MVALKSLLHTRNPLVLDMSREAVARPSGENIGAGQVREEGQETESTPYKYTQVSVRVGVREANEGSGCLAPVASDADEMGLSGNGVIALMPVSAERWRGSQLPACSARRCCLHLWASVQFRRSRSSLTPHHFHYHQL